MAALVSLFHETKRLGFLEGPGRAERSILGTILVNWTQEGRQPRRLNPVPNSPELLLVKIIEKIALLHFSQNL